MGNLRSNEMQPHDKTIEIHNPAKVDHSVITSGGNLVKIEAGKTVKFAAGHGAEVLAEAKLSNVPFVAVKPEHKHAHDKPVEHKKGHKKTA